VGRGLVTWLTAAGYILFLEDNTKSFWDWLAVDERKKVRKAIDKNDLVMPWPSLPILLVWE
jgi:hypothetical protein